MSMAVTRIHTQDSRPREFVRLGEVREEHG